MVYYIDFQPKTTSRVHEATEWSITYTYNAPDTTLPRVLLIGDSICNAYQARVRDKLDGKVNVSFWASSKCVTDREYFRELDFMLGAYQYDVVTFNNGLHSLGTNRAEWEAAYTAVLRFIRAKLPDAKLLLVSTTPLKDSRLTAVSAELADYAKKTAVSQGLGFINLFAAFMPLDRELYWSDTYHFKPSAVNMQAEIIAGRVREAL
ncbi:MAG: SGNH/GDSL hydrolase family protein [Clostridia bacterium]|nr:SGNH/GDSL hydrolase family protein [Clostridia bacterium]